LCWHSSYSPGLIEVDRGVLADDELATLHALEQSLAELAARNRRFGGR